VEDDITQRAATTHKTRSTGRLTVVLLANWLLRIASSGGGALAGFYLAALARAGQPIDPALVGALSVVSNIAELLGAVPLGMLADRYGPRRILIISTLVGAAATQLFGISGVIAIFFVSRSLESVASVAGGPALLTHLTDATQNDAALRGRVMGLYELSLLGGVALGSFVGGAAWVRFETLGFALLATAYALAALLFAWGTRGVRPAVPPSDHPLSGLRHALTDPLLRRLAPAWLAVNAIIGLWLTHIGFQLSGPRVAGQALVGSLRPDAVGTILLGYAVALGVGIVAWSYALAVVGRLRALRWSLAALLVFCAALYTLNLPLGWSDDATRGLAILAALAIALGSGFTPAALAYLSDVIAGGEGRGAALGIYTALFSIGGALGAGLGGVLAQWFALNGLIAGTAGLIVIAFLSLRIVETWEGEKVGR
jgi:MFS family permease